MAVDKLVDSTQIDADLTSIANAIRTKGGTSGSLAFPSGFVSAVQAIPTGITPTGTKQISITQNGTTTEDVTNYASAEITVNVSGGGGADWNDIVTKNVTGTVTITAGRVYDYSFYSQPVESVVAPNATQFDQFSFSRCQHLGSCFFPEVTTFSGAGTFSYSGGTTMASTNCILVFPKLALGNVRATFDRGNFLAIDIGPNTTNLFNDTFYHNTGVQTVGALILRRTASIVTASTTGAINGLRDVYVPSALISQYEAATNWSTQVSGGYITFHSIEGSQYENYYADGTSIT